MSGDGDDRAQNDGPEEFDFVVGAERSDGYSDCGGFVIDHRASKLRVAPKSLVAGLHEFNSSRSQIAFAPASWGSFGGRLFVAEFGDLAPNTTPLRNGPAGFQIAAIDPRTKRAVPFVRNVKPGPASRQGAKGQGVERPYDVKFGPDGAMYISDYGILNVNPARIRQGQVPYEAPPRSGAI